MIKDRGKTNICCYAWCIPLLIKSPGCSRGHNPCGIRGYFPFVSLDITIPNFEKLKWAVACIGLHVNAHKTEYMCYNQTGNIATLDRASLKLVDKFTKLGSSVSSSEKDIDTRLMKAWTAIDRLSIIWKSDLTDKMKCSFFQAAVVSILLYGCTTWTLTKRLEKKLDRNYTRMLRAVLNKSWRQHPTRHQLYGHLPPHHENYTSQKNQTCRTLLEKQGRAHKWCTPMDPHIWPCKSRTTSSNLHTATMWGYRM